VVSVDVIKAIVRVRFIHFEFGKTVFWKRIDKNDEKQLKIWKRIDKKLSKTIPKPILENNSKTNFGK